MTAVRPQNLFGPMLGLTGLAEAWYVAWPVPGTPVAVAGRSSWLPQRG